MKNFKNSTRNALLAGKNIFRDTHGNIIYYHERQNVSYRIPPNKENTFVTFRSRYTLDLICFTFLYILFDLNIYLSVGICAVTGIFLEYRYRSFLKKLVHSNGLKQSAKLKSTDQAVELSRGAMLLRIVLYIALAALLVINTFVSVNVSGNRSLIVFSYILAVFAGYIGIKYMMMFARHKDFQKVL